MLRRSGNKLGERCARNRQQSIQPSVSVLIASPRGVSSTVGNPSDNISSVLLSSDPDHPAMLLVGREAMDGCDALKIRQVEIIQY
ncbi:unnamed protein product [Nezara viridula]|uniref:Uncharacterized protein n=1 Tax=Nezara viridula TaxID=85310 RepID=A0A9P0HKB8_NEZVI|nr:unnamed protein product [Nezara viridula]